MTKQTAQMLSDVQEDQIRNIERLLGYMEYIVIAGCVVGLFIVALKMATSYRNGELGEHISGFTAVAAACILVAIAPALAKVLLEGIL